MTLGGIIEENTALVAAAIGSLIFSWLMKLVCQGLAEICAELVCIRVLLESMQLSPHTSSADPVLSAQGKEGFGSNSIPQIPKTEEHFSPNSIPKSRF